MVNFDDLIVNIHIISIEKGPVYNKKYEDKYFRKRIQGV